MAEHSLIFHRSHFDLAQAQTLLQARGLSVTPERDELRVRWGDGPVLRVTQRRGEEVAQLALNTPHASELSDCNACFQIAFDDLDEALDEINTLIETQATLQDATNGWLFNTWNEHLSAPE